MAEFPRMRLLEPKGKLDDLIHKREAEIESAREAKEHELREI